MQCTKCGAELLQGQRFCRACGNPSRPLEGNVEPTKSIDTDPEGLVQVNKTSRAVKVDTNPVTLPAQGETAHMEDTYSPTMLMPDHLAPQGRSTGQGEPPSPQTSPIAETTQASDSSIHSTTPFQMENGRLRQAPPPANFHAPQAPLYVPPPRPQQKSYGWLIALCGIGVFGLIFLAFLIFARLQRGKMMRPPPPPPPAVQSRGADKSMDETSARETSDETVFTQKFPLPNSAKFSLRNMRGAITITGTDSTEAEVKVIKKGGTPEERKRLQILYSTIGGNLSLRPSDRLTDNLEIVYEIKLPRNLGQVNIEAVSSEIKIEDIDALLSIHSVSGDLELTRVRGKVEAETQSGEIFLSKSIGPINVKSISGKIELADVSGAIQTSNTSGDTKATIESTASSDTLTFESINGDIDLRFKEEINAELEASTVSGELDANNLGVEVKIMPGSTKAIGRLGIGGPTLKVKSVTGNINISKKS